MKKVFFKKINFIESNILQQNDLSITKDLLFNSEKLKVDKSNALLISTIEFIQSTERFKYPFSIINNRLDWHLLYKPFNMNFLPAIKEIDCFITPSFFHFHIHFFIFVLTIKQILPSLVCFPIINITTCDNSFTFTFLFNKLFYMSSRYLVGIK